MKGVDTVDAREVAGIVRYLRLSTDEVEYCRRSRHSRKRVDTASTSDVAEVERHLKQKDKNKQKDHPGRGLIDAVAARG